tara:strand:- start:71 stop:3187 length:3117 start_codon:yes stop_codon:yes gene_type:complete
MFKAATKKLALDQAVTGGITEGSNKRKKPNVAEIEDILRAGATAQFGGEADQTARAFEAATIEEIMERHTRRVAQPNSGIQAVRGRGLGSVSQVSYDGGEMNAVKLDDPEFWKKVLPKLRSSDALLAKLNDDSLIGAEALPQRLRFYAEIQGLVQQLIAARAAGETDTTQYEHDSECTTVMLRQMCSMRGVFEDEERKTAARWLFDLEATGPRGAPRRRRSKKDEALYAGMIDDEEEEDDEDDDPFEDNISGDNDAYPSPKGRRRNPRRSSSRSTGKRRGRCGKCRGCYARACGKCKYCINPKLHRPCIKRKCIRLGKSQSQKSQISAAENARIKAEKLRVKLLQKQRAEQIKIHLRRMCSGRVYHCLDDETPRIVSQKWGVPEDEVLQINTSLYGRLLPHSKFIEGTVVKLPWRTHVAVAIAAPSTPVGTRVMRERKPKSVGISERALIDQMLREGGESPPPAEGNPSAGSVRATLRAALNELSSHPESAAFLTPVSLLEAPDYRDIVDHPMDFATIATRLQYGIYDVPELNGPAAFASDVRLTFENCKEYNVEGSMLRDLAEVMQQSFNEMWRDSALCKPWEQEMLDVLSEASSGKRRTRKRRTKTLAAVALSQRSSQLLKLIDRLAQDKDASMFLQAVDEEVVPGYYDLIDEPMDLETLRARVASGRHYQDQEDEDGEERFEADVELIWRNCQDFNQKGSQIWLKAQQMRLKFEALAATKAFTAKAKRTRAASEEGEERYPNGRAKRSRASRATAPPPGSGGSSSSSSSSSASSSSSSSSSSNLPPLETELECLLTAVTSDDRAAMFLKPIDVSEAPGYSKTVKEPMDFGTIRTNLVGRAKAYGAGPRKGGKRAFVRDMRLVFSNCKRYNKEGSSVWQSAEDLRLVFERALLRSGKKSKTSRKTPAKRARAQSGSGGGARSARPAKKMSRGRLQYLAIVDVLMDDEDSAAFRKPVRKSDAPGYHDLIANPMDLTTIRRKAFKDVYTNDSSSGDVQFKIDLELVWSNCQKYNVEGSEFWLKAESMRKKVAKVLRKM